MSGSAWSKESSCSLATACGAACWASGATGTTCSCVIGSRPASYPSPGMLTERAISIVVPCYNEQANIEALHERVVAVMDKVTADWELVFVDNGSRDESRKTFAELAAKDERVTVLSLSR